MLRHVSVQADEPRRVAAVIAELWGGEAFPFPIASDDAWMAVADDGRGSMIEVLPRGTELREGAGEEEAIGVLGPVYRFTASHIAMDTVLDAPAVFAIGEREGWPMKYGSRAGGVFHVIEAWVEGCSMFEIMTAEARARYMETLTIANCRTMLTPQRASVRPVPAPRTA